MHYHFLTYFLCSFFVFSTSYSEQAAHSSIYKKIEPINLSSLNWNEKDWPNESFHDYLTRSLRYQTNLQEIEKRKVVFQIFDTVCKKPTEHTCLHDTHTIYDLNLLAGKQPEKPYFGQIIDRTRTQLGKVFLYGMISNPIDDIIQLRARQDIARFLVENKSLYKELDHLFVQFSATENLLLSLWLQDGFLQATKRSYFSLPYITNINNALNRSSLALQTKALMQHYERAMFVISGIAATIILPIHGVATLLGKSLPNSIEEFAQRLHGSGGPTLAFISSLVTQKPTDAAPDSFSSRFSAWFAQQPLKYIVTAELSLLVGLMYVFALQEGYDWAKDNFTLEKYVQQKMVSICQFINTIERVSHIIKAHPALRKACPAAATIDTFMRTTAKKPDIQRLFALCKSTTFKGKPSTFSFHGRVLVAFKLIYDLKETFEPLFLALGELDAYLSCAKLYTEFCGTRIHFCFPQYTADTQPSITMIDFWNPFIDSQKVVTNTITITGPDKRDMIITGPNAGGKSTLIKAIPLNLILAQSIGLAAATSATITPFHSIATYLNIVDDIAAGNSLFKAQVLRAQEIINLVEQTPQNKFSFVALDEMFNGTSAKESTAAAYSVVKHIGNYANNICVVATHFPLLTKLADIHAAFENYKVSVHIDEHQHIQYPFKLELGVSHQHIALDILHQEGYGSSIVTQAMATLASLA